MEGEMLMYFFVDSEENGLAGDKTGKDLILYGLS